MSQSEKRAEGVKEAIAELLRIACPDRKSKQALADYLECSYSSVEGLIYRLQGGTDLWINALLFLFDLESEVVKQKVGDLKTILTKKHPVKESDRTWFKEIGSLFTEEEKSYWLSIMKYAAKLKRNKRL